jgi:hypothetical protein
MYDGLTQASEDPGQEDVKKLIWLIYQGFVFDRKCTPEPQ